MKVILLEDVKKQGKKGEVIEVSPGYGRNYLIKNGLAKEATTGALNQLKSIKKAEEQQAAEDKAEAKKLKEQLEKEDTVVTVKAKAGEGGRLFGAITSKQIAEALNQQYEIKIDRRKIEMDNNLTALGFYNIPIKLYAGVDTTIRVNVIEQ